MEKVFELIVDDESVSGDGTGTTCGPAGKDMGVNVQSGSNGGSGIIGRHY